MRRVQTRTLLAGLLLGASLGVTRPLLAAPQAAATIRHVAVLGRGRGIEVEIVASGPVTPQAQVVTGPDRIVIDFPNTFPGSALRPIMVNRGKVKRVRSGLFSANPPVTRVVVDLKSAQPYQVVSAGNRVVVKLSGGSEEARAFHTQFEIVQSLAVSPQATVPPAEAPAQVTPPRRMEVEFRNGRLRIWADKVTLAELLNEVHRKTGADIPIPAGAEQELVVANMGPGPAQDVLATLLNGSRFNFIMVGSKDDPVQLRSVLLSPKGGPLRQPVDYPPAAPVAQAAPAPAPAAEEEPEPTELPGAAEPPQR